MKLYPVIDIADCFYHSGSYVAMNFNSMHLEVCDDHPNLISHFASSNSYYGHFISGIQIVTTFNKN
ncbi:MAG: hypothetical protein ACSLE0_14560 [Chitinophagaceae bacterium]